MTVEFDCAECGRSIWRATGLAENEPRLCAECLCVPGWIEDAELRRLLDPGGQVKPEKILGTR